MNAKLIEIKQIETETEQLRGENKRLHELESSCPPTMKLADGQGG